MPKVGGRRKKARSHNVAEDELQKELPKTFVVKKGDISSQLQETVHDLRRCFYPNTAMKLQDSSKIDMKTYLKTAKYYNVTHLVVLQQSNLKNYLRIIKVGGGQMVFRVLNYCRMRDALHHGGQPFSFSFKDPLVVLNGFGENSQIRMIGHGFQEMFPAINPQKLKVQRLKRVVSLTYSANKKVIYFRHYKIVVHEGGVNKSFANLLQQKSPDLSRFATIGDYLASLNNVPEREGEQNKQKVNLVEIGPRFKLKFLHYKQKSGHVQERGDEEVPEIQHPEMGGGDQSQQ